MQHGREVVRFDITIKVCILILLVGTNQLTKGTGLHFWGDWSSSALFAIWRAWMQNAARVPGSPQHQGLFHGLGRLWRRHLHHCGLLRGVPPDRAFMGLKGNISWALQSGAPGFIGTYCFLGLSLKMSGHTADLRTSATHARIEPVPVQRYEHCPDYHQPQFMWETCSPCGFKQ